MHMYCMIDLAMHGYRVLNEYTGHPQVKGRVELHEIKLSHHTIH